MIMWLPFLVDGERPFIDEEFADMRENHGIITEGPNKETTAKARGVTGSKCQMGIVTQL